MRPIRLFKRILLAAAAPLLVLAGLEGTLRLLDAGYPADFLLKRAHGDQTIWMDNPVFGYRFFPHSITRTPPPVVVPMIKGSNEFRVVVLGESAAMGEPEPAFGPARMLEKMLSRSMTGQTVRVINAAMTAINSHVIAEIARELPKLQPDVVILYIGNNEVVGPFGPGTVIGRYVDSKWITRLTVKASRLRITSLMRAAYFRYRQSDSASWQGMEMFAGQRLSEDDPRLDTTRMAFRENLDIIIKNARSAGARVLLSTVAVNVNDQAPLDGTDYGAGQSREGLKRIRDRDQLRFRADSSINRIIRAIAAENGDLMFADPEAHADYLNLPDEELFIDHVHFTPRGAYELAHQWLNALGHQQTIRYEELRDALGWTEVNQLEISEIMIQRLSREPFKSAGDYAIKMDRWSRARTSALRSIHSRDSSEVMKSLDSLVQSQPADPYYHQLAYTAAKAYGEPERARQSLEKLAALWPHRIEVRGWQAMDVATLPDQPAVWPVITESMPELGMLPADLLAGISESLYREGHGEASIRVLQEAVQHFPHLSRIRIALASRLAQAGLSEEAEKEYLHLMNKNADDRTFRREYAGFLISQGKFTDAEGLLRQLRADSHELDIELKWIQFLILSGQQEQSEKAMQEILRQHPLSADALELAAGVQARMNRIDEAIRLFEAALRLEPWRETAGWKLAGLYDMTGNKAKSLETLKALVPYSINPPELEADIRELEASLR